MSREELVSAYVNGGVSRRTFIRRLVAGGVSLGAAISYAHLLAPGRASAAPSSAGDGRDHYEPEISVEILTQRLRKLLHTRVLRVHLTSNDAASFTLLAQIKANGKLKTIATSNVSFAAPTDSILELAVTKAGRRLLLDRQKAWVQVVATAAHQQAQGTFTSAATATAVLK